MIDASEVRQLELGLKQLGIDAAVDRVEKLAQYLGLMIKWNKVYNLTAIREVGRMVSHHLLDSAAILPHLPHDDLLDVGTGPGLPGIPLAILRPDLRVTLLDSNQKKTAFLRQAVGELELGNADVVCDRIEGWTADRRFRLITSRAFSELAEFVLQSARFLAPHGCFAAMKGLLPEDEIARLPAGYRAEKVIELHVPGVDAKRHLVMIGRS